MIIRLCQQKTCKCLRFPIRSSMERIYNKEQAMHQRLQATRTRRRLSVCFDTLTKLTTAYVDPLSCIQLEHSHLRHHYSLSACTLAGNTLRMGSIRVLPRREDTVEVTQRSLWTENSTHIVARPLLVNAEESWIHTT